MYQSRMLFFLISNSISDFFQKIVMGDRCFEKNQHVTVTFPQHHNHFLIFGIERILKFLQPSCHLHCKIKHSTFFLFLNPSFPKETLHLRYNPPSCFNRADKAKIPAPFHNPTIVVESIFDSLILRNIFTSTEVANPHDTCHHLFCPYPLLMRKRLHLRWQGHS